VLSLVTAAFELINTGLAYVRRMVSSLPGARQDRVLRLNHKHPVDIVLTTTTTSPHEALGIERDVTTLGNIRAASAVVYALAKRSGGNGGIHLELSRTPDHLTGDLVVIGGPKQNSIARRILDRLADAHHHLEIEFNDTDQANACLRVAGLERHYSITMQDENADHPTEDYAVVVVWLNPLASAHRRRLIWCAGFTSNGTQAATEYLFESVLPQRYWLRGRAAGESPRRDRRLKPRRFGSLCCFIMVLHIEFAGETGVCSELLLRPIAAGKR
jgi:hypothetical protein